MVLQESMYISQSLYLSTIVPIDNVSSTIVPINHHVNWPLCLWWTIIPINQHAYWLSCLSKIMHMPVDHSAYWPPCPSTIMPRAICSINASFQLMVLQESMYISQSLYLLTIVPIDHVSSFIVPSGLFFNFSASSLLMLWHSNLILTMVIPTILFCHRAGHFWY